MTLLLAFLLLLVTVPVAGGRLSRLEELRIRGLWLVALAFAIQVLLVTVVPSGDPTLHRVAHIATYGLAAACILRNLDLRFVWVVAVGGLLNFIAIAANGGVMPASRRRSARRGPRRALRRFRQLRSRSQRSRRLPRRRLRHPRRLAGGERVQRWGRGDASGGVPGPPRRNGFPPVCRQRRTAPARASSAHSTSATSASGEVRSSRLPPRAV